MFLAETSKLFATECDGTGDPHIEEQVCLEFHYFLFIVIISYYYFRSNVQKHDSSFWIGWKKEQNALIVKALDIISVIYVKGKVLPRCRLEYF